MIDALFKYTFLQNAVISAILTSIVCGIIGTVIVEKKLVTMTGGIAHTSFGGIGMGYFLNIEPIIGGLLFSLLASLGIVTIKRKTNTNIDAIMGIFWSAGMAFGILFIAITPGYPPDMSTYLFGDILTVTRVNLWVMLALDIVIVFLITAFFNYFKAYFFDREFTSVMKINVMLFEYMIFIMIALSVVVLIKVVGIILIIALLTIPPSIARMFTYNLKKIMIISILLCMIFCLLGLWTSYLLNIASGASIILLAAVTYVFVVLLRNMRKKKFIIHE